MSETSDLENLMSRWTKAGASHLALGHVVLVLVVRYQLELLHLPDLLAVDRADLRLGGDDDQVVAREELDRSDEAVDGLAARVGRNASKRCQGYKMRTKRKESESIRPICH